MTEQNWQTVKFGDVVRNVTDTERNPLDKGITRYVGLADLDSESIQLKRWGSLEDDETTFTRLFREGQMLFGRRRAYQRKAALAPFDGICSGDIIVMEAKPDKLLPDLLPFLIHTDGFFNYAMRTSAGSLSPRTKWSHLAKYEFALPPLDEQRRIAEILWAVEENYRKAYQVVQHSKTLFVRACQQWTAYQSQHTSENWIKVKLEECAEILDSQRVPIRQSKRAKMQGDIPYYGANGIIDHINDNIFDGEIVLIGEDGDHFMKYNDWEQSYFVDIPCWVNNHAHVFRADTEVTTNMWLYRYFQFRNILPYLQDSASMTRKKLTQGNLRIIPIRMPDDICDQKRVTEAIDEVEAAYKKAVSHAEECKILVKSLIAYLVESV